MTILNSCFYNMSKWVWTPCKANEDLGVFAGGFNVRYRGQQGNNSIVSNRYNSTSAAFYQAYAFTEGKTSSSMHVLMLSNQVKVLDIRSFLGVTNNRYLVCFPDECELLILPGMNYQQLTLEETRRIHNEKGSAYNVSSEATSVWTSMNSPMNVFYWYVTDPSEQDM